jgi:hypothetical protein
MHCACECAALPSVREDCLSSVPAHTDEKEDERAHTLVLQGEDGAEG